MCAANSATPMVRSVITVHEIHCLPYYLSIFTICLVQYSESKESLLSPLSFPRFGQLTRNSGLRKQKHNFPYGQLRLSAPNLIISLRELIASPPADRPYDILKEQLIKRTTASEQRRLQLLLSADDLGDRKPSHLLRRMQQLLGSSARSVDDALFHGLFLQCLPSSVRMILASSSETVNVQSLAEIADKILEATPAGCEGEVSEVRQEIAKLRTHISRLQFSTAHRKTKNAKLSSTDSSNLCWYHLKFGSKAKKPPRSHSGNGVDSH
ncbi:hypothetical protein M513_08875 [Trichuris suis]|uniref:DUF7041 domain-containing protein n=1 Tax=Trichuris suis TaxID=68888 RepID=A0A085LZ51_9BILA|nr:hypothetical protein M513_08875 [Trichuris suis]